MPNRTLLQQACPKPNRTPLQRASGFRATPGQGGPTPDFANVMIMPLTRKCHVYRQLSWWDMMVMLLCVRGKSGVHKEDVTLVHFGSGSPEGSPTSVSKSALRCSWSAGPPIPPCDAARRSAPKSRVFQRDTVHKEGAALVRFDSGLLLTVRGSGRLREHNGILRWPG
jgi:hypothetical protein